MTHRLFRYTGKREVYCPVIDQTDPEVSEYSTIERQAKANALAQNQDLGDSSLLDCRVDDAVMPLINSCLQTAFATASRYIALIVVVGCLSTAAQAAAVVDSRLDDEKSPTSTADMVAADRSPPDRSSRILLAQASAQPDSGTNWNSALPPTDKYDWLQTTSGEWLKGELKVLYSGSLEFDSKKFKLRTLKMKDVAQYLGHGSKRVSIQTPTGNRIIDGVVSIDRLRVMVVSDQGEESFDRSQLISITPGASAESDNWSGKISLGLNYTRGNTDQTDKIGSLLIRRRTPGNRLLINYMGQESDVNNFQTVNNHRLNLLYDVYPERGFFWRPLYLEYYHDPFQNIDHRATISIGAGYHLLDKPGITWNVSGGPAYQATRYDSVQDGEEDQADTPALVAGTFFDTALTNTVDFKTLYNVTILNRESGTYTHHARATFEIELTSIFDLDFELVWDRTRDPQPRADGSIPDQDDIQWLLTLGIEF